MIGIPRIPRLHHLPASYLFVFLCVSVNLEDRIMGHLQVDAPSLSGRDDEV